MYQEGLRKRRVNDGTTGRGKNNQPRQFTQIYNKRNNQPRTLFSTGRNICKWVLNAGGELVRRCFKAGENNTRKNNSPTKGGPTRGVPTRRRAGSP
jgi:hypothetical protein